MNSLHFLSKFWSSTTKKSQNTSIITAENFMRNFVCQYAATSKYKKKLLPYLKKILNFIFLCLFYVFFLHISNANSTRSLIMYYAVWYLSTAKLTSTKMSRIFLFIIFYSLKIIIFYSYFKFLLFVIKPA